MTRVDLLSDTTYRQQSVQQLHQLLGNNTKFPVKGTQIYGLRQIARQQPGEVGAFANHQRNRAQSKYDSNPKPSLQSEIDFWALVANLCSDSASNWSVPKEGHPYLPEELRDQNRREPQGATQQETQKNQEYNNKLKKSQQEWFKQWGNEHIPAFFERFCTHCLYCIAQEEMGQLGGEGTNAAHQQSQQEQSEIQDGGTMHAALQQVNLIE